VIRDGEQLLIEEDEGWAILHAVLGRIPRARIGEAGVTEKGWSPKDVMFHVGAWLAEASHQLERIRVGTYVPEDNRVEERNRAWFALSRTLDVPTVLAQLGSSRVVTREAFGSLARLTPEAREWFQESGALHYAEHVPDLVEWLER
jgi:hypothetical protein